MGTEFEAATGVANNPVEEMADPVGMEIGQSENSQDQQGEQLDNEEDAREERVRADPQDGDEGSDHADSRAGDGCVDRNHRRQIGCGAEGDHGRNEGNACQHQGEGSKAEAAAELSPTPAERVPDQGVVTTGDGEGRRQLGPAVSHEDTDDRGENHRQDGASAGGQDDERDDDEHGRRRRDGGHRDRDVAEDTEAAMEFLLVLRPVCRAWLSRHDVQPPSRPSAGTHSTFERGTVVWGIPRRLG